MSIRNYTSSVPAEKSMQQIEKILIGMGARNIMKEYDGFGKVLSIAFSVHQGDGVIPFRLPAKADAIKKLLLKEYRRPSRAQEEAVTAQAERTAWKNVKEWVELQATMIKLEQAEFMEVFLPYVYSLQAGQTFYQKIKESGFKQLTA